MKNLEELVIAYPTKGWRIATVGDVAQVKGGKRLPKGEKFAEIVTPFPYIRVTDFVGFCVDTSDIRYLRPETQAAIRRYTISMNDIYISIAGSIGITGMIPSELEGANLTENAAKLVVNHQLVYTRFLMYFLSSEIAQREIRGQTVKNAQPKLALARVASIKIPVPPLPEQRKIAGVLGVVQRAMEQQERLLALTAELKKALLHKLFTEGLRGEPQKQTDIGPVPESWDVVELISAVEQIDYGISAPIPKTPPENGVKIVSTADITKDGRLLYEKIRRIVAPEKTVKRLTLQTGDVLFNWRNSAELIGKSAVFQEQSEPHVFASFILRIKCGEKKSHNFFLAHLMNYFRETSVFLKLARRAVNQANYNRNEISVLKIPLPTYPEQRKIAEVIGAVDAKLRHHRQKEAKLEALFRTLLHQLMTAQLRVHDLDLPELEAFVRNGKP